MSLALDRRTPQASGEAEVVFTEMNCIFRLYSINQEIREISVESLKIRQKCISQ
jgi:hypothetical protein